MTATAPLQKKFSNETAKVSRAQWVYDHLRHAIHHGDYARGDRIREEEVARMLGVSRTPVREAILRLQARGLLELSAGGLVVATLTRPQLVELYAMRAILEGSAARFAAQHAAPSEIETMHFYLDKFSAATDPDELADINSALHGAIYEAAHNRYLLETLDELNDTLALLPGTTFQVMDRKERGHEEHQAIISAISKRNPDEAENMARKHIQLAQETRLKLYFENP